MQIELQDAVIILDEAHNIEDICRYHKQDVDSFASDLCSLTCQSLSLHVSSGGQSVALANLPEYLYMMCESSAMQLKGTLRLTPCGHLACAGTPHPASWS